MTRPIRQLALEGDLDLTRTSQLNELFRDAQDDDVVVLDLSAVTYLDSSALSSFVRLRNAMLANGRAGTVKIVGLAPPLRRIFAVSALDQVFELADSK